MKIVFMGTPEFAATALSAIVSGGHEVVLAVTQQDKAKGRGNKMQYTAVKERAMELGVEVLQPGSFNKGGEAAERIAGCCPEIIVTAAYGRILPANILKIPKYGCVNIHASLLPRWRGAAPVQRAVIEGDEVTGVTIMHMDEGIDTGDIILSKSTCIEMKTAGELFGELALIGAELIIRAIDMIADGSAVRTAQDDNSATYAPMISKEDGLLNFSENPVKLERLIRGVDPQPGARTVYNGETMKVYKAVPKRESNRYRAGTVTGVSSGGIAVSAGGETLLLTEIQMPGKKRLEIREFLKGNTIEKFAVLG